MPEMARSGKRIALVFHGLSGGGIERSMLRLAAGLRDRGHAVDIVVQRCRGELVDEVPEGIAIHETGDQPVKIANKKLGKIVRKAKKHARVLRLRADLLRRAPLSWRLFLSPDLRALRPLGRLEPLPGLVRYLRRRRPDAMLAAEPHYNTMAVLARRIARVSTRVVIAEHVHLSGEKWSDRHLGGLMRDCYLSADAIIAVSNGVGDELATLAGIPRERIITVHNPVVGPDILAMAKEPVDHPWFVPGAPPVILAVGRIHPQKDFPTLVRAFARTRAEREGRLVVLGADWEGDTGYADNVRSLASDLGIAGDVDFAGFVTNPFAYMAASALFVLSSRYEGLPTVIIEALACGCPVVSTDCPSGPMEILENGRYGPLVPMGDDKAMAAAMTKTLDAPPSKDLLRARGASFSNDSAVDFYLRLLLDRDPGATRNE